MTGLCCQAEDLHGRMLVIPFHPSQSSTAWGDITSLLGLAIPVNTTIDHELNSLEEKYPLLSHYIILEVNLTPRCSI